MSSSVVFAPPPTLKNNSIRNYALLAGGYFSLAFAAFQVSGIWWTSDTIRHWGGPADLSVQKPLVYALLCLAVAAVVAMFGLYALSGAGKIRRLPLLRTGLTVTTAIYLARGLLFIPQFPVVWKHPHLARFLVFSLISLGVGVVYLIGVMHLYRHGRPGEARMQSVASEPRELVHANER